MVHLPRFMTNGSSKNEKDKDSSVYDFISMKRTQMILSGFLIVDKTVFHLVLNVLWLGTLYVLCPYLFVTGVITVNTIPLGKATKVELLQDMALLLAIPSLSMNALRQRDNLNLVIKTLKTGVYLYDDDNESISEVKRKYIDQFVRMTSIVYKLISAFAISKVVFPLILNLTTSNASSAKSPLNPYLPLQLYSPFDTRTTGGFLLAFVSQVMFLFFLDIVFTCHVETYVSCAIQFTAQYEVLNFSLRNIERRAQLMLMKQSFSPSEVFDFNTPEYQTCLLSCLRENIKHHHAILRFRKIVRLYIESASTLAVTFFSLLVAGAATPLLQDPTADVALIILLFLLFFGYLTMCWVGQMITDKSSETKDSLYSTPWPQCGKLFRTLLCTMMVNTQKPVVLRARVFRYDVSLENYADMVILAYKIINVLR